MGSTIEIMPFDVFCTRDRFLHPNVRQIEPVKPQKGKKKQHRLLVVVA
tara:strand:+ start:498 stop:641 length:144 start_codon:yes stop_codon:yes gene_type:complete